MKTSTRYEPLNPALVPWLPFCARRLKHNRCCYLCQCYGNAPSAISVKDGAFSRIRLTVSTSILRKFCEQCPFAMSIDAAAAATRSDDSLGGFSTEGTAEEHHSRLTYREWEEGAPVTRRPTQRMATLACVRRFRYRLGIRPAQTRRPSRVESLAHIKGRVTSTHSCYKQINLNKY